MIVFMMYVFPDFNLKITIMGSTVLSENFSVYIEREDKFKRGK